ncbi:MAG TPA: hypothetical protein VEL07_19330 [Planctomycetota bacterium]|nr:hypothetical protein [Planctomycetota bacterium]
MTREQVRAWKRDLRKMSATELAAVRVGIAALLVAACFETTRRERRSRR